LKDRYKQDVKASKTQTWEQYVKATFGIGRSRADELIRIGEGRATLEDTRAVKAASVAKSKAKVPKTAASSGGSATVFAKTDATDDEPAQAEGTFPVHFGSCHGGRVGTKPKAKAADAPGLVQTDPDHLIAQFIAHVRASSLDIMRQTDAAYQPRFIERLREVIDEIEVEAERWAKEAQHEEMPGIPDFLRRT
jgi:hypothetical protein